MWKTTLHRKTFHNFFHSYCDYIIWLETIY